MLNQNQWIFKESQCNARLTNNGYSKKNNTCLRKTSNACATKSMRVRGNTMNFQINTIAAYSKKKQWVSLQR